MEDKLLTTKEAALVLGMAPGTLENWRVNGFGPAHVRVGARAIRYHESALMAWLVARRVAQQGGKEGA